MKNDLLNAAKEYMDGTTNSDDFLGLVIHILEYVDLSSEDITWFADAILKGDKS